MCGKNGDILARSMTALGSPPRVREKLDTVVITIAWLGITPACAGKTLKGPNEIKTFLSF